MHLDAVDEVVFSDTVDVLKSVRRGHSSARSPWNEINLWQQGREGGRVKRRGVSGQDKLESYHDTDSSNGSKGGGTRRHVEQKARRVTRAGASATIQLPYQQSACDPA